MPPVPCPAVTSRTVLLHLVSSTRPGPLVPEPGDIDQPLDAIAQVLPDLQPELLALRDGGWEFGEASAWDGGAFDPNDDDAPLLDVAVTFRKTFDGATEEAVTADARACGLTEEAGTPSFAWADGGRSEDGGDSWLLEDRVD